MCFVGEFNKLFNSLYLSNSIGRLHFFFFFLQATTGLKALAYFQKLKQPLQQPAPANTRTTIDGKQRSKFKALLLSKISVLITKSGVVETSSLLNNVRAESLAADIERELCKQSSGVKVIYLFIMCRMCCACFIPCYAPLLPDFLNPEQTGSKSVTALFNL